MAVRSDLCGSQDHVAGQSTAAESEAEAEVELSYLTAADHIQSKDVNPGVVDQELDIARLTDLYDSLFMSVSSGSERRSHERGCVSAGGSVGAADSSSALLSISRNSLISGQLDNCCELNLDLDESGRKVGAVECFLSAALRLASQSKLTIKSAADGDFTFVCNGEQDRSSSELTKADTVNTLNQECLIDAGTEAAAAAAELSSPAPEPADLSASLPAAVSLLVSAAAQTDDSDCACACADQEQHDESADKAQCAEAATSFDLSTLTDADGKDAQVALIEHYDDCESALDCEDSAVLRDSVTECSQALHDSVLGADDESYLISSCSDAYFYGLQTADPYSDHDLFAVDELYGCALLSGEPGQQPVTGAESVTVTEAGAVTGALAGSVTGAFAVPVSATVSVSEDQSAAGGENSTVLLQLPEGLCSASCVSPSALSTASCARYLNDSTGRQIHAACSVSHCPVMSGVDEGCAAALVNDAESNNSAAGDASCVHSHDSQLEHSCDNSLAQGRFTEPVTGSCSGTAATEHKEKTQFCAETQNVLDTESSCALKYFIKSDNAADFTADNKESHHSAALHGGCAADRACTSDLKVDFAPQAFTSNSSASGSEQEQTAAINRRRSFQGSRWWGGVLKVCNKLLLLADCAGINTSALRSRIGRMSVQA
ncbi:hypothetical protein [Anaerobiospirillum sp. NML120511]|uniref:hypothetical protein n=1 Tax=Anaerobiospirillum sp. NML120511 TaxID=2932819 RepID=UPI001FF20BBF|nr:hypothetical protein [Anaerobiospirillum sp. NML120511]MCK0534602.1 hypothetical protein [Anaerobiospirillum sp. NML120511]